MTEKDDSEYNSISSFTETELSVFQSNIKFLAVYCKNNSQYDYVAKLKILYDKLESRKRELDTSWFSDVSDASNDNRKASESSVAGSGGQSACGDTHARTLANSRKAAGGQS